MKRCLRAQDPFGRCQKVVRDSRLREALAGDPWSHDDQDDWLAVVTCFVDGAAPKGTKRGRKPATYDLGVLLHDAMVEQWGVGLDHFAGGTRVPRSLVTALDCCSSNKWVFSLNPWV